VRGARDASGRLALHKRWSHRLKRSLHDHPRLDAWLDDRLAAGATGPRAWLRDRALLRLLPERRVRDTPFATDAPAPRRGTVQVLSLVPPEDAGGGSRPAQLAVELRRRGFAIDWRWALPIYPWPKLRRPVLAGVEMRHVTEPAPAGAAGGAARDLVLLEAPHPALVRAALDDRGREPVLYDAIDVWDGALGAGWYERDAEDRAIARADVLVASADLLRCEIARRSGRAVHLLPNAVDRRRFDPQRAHPVPADVRRGAPTVVYVGALWGEWVDLDLIAGLASRLPRAEIHLVGHPGSRSVPRARNLHMLGPRPQAVIPAYLQAADVAIVPFVGGRLADAVSPLKVFEALAMHRPVVATPLPELADVPGVRLAARLAAFAEAVAASTAQRLPIDEVEAFLVAHTWSARVDSLLELTGIERG
jgi:glycosyltransferase involved in cell wall biosynthesis